MGLVFDLQSTLPPMPLDQYLKKSFPDQEVLIQSYPPDVYRMLKRIDIFLQTGITDPQYILTDLAINNPARLMVESLPYLAHLPERWFLQALSFWEKGT